MAISPSTTDNENKKFKEASSLTGQPGVVVVNPDGSNIGGGSGSNAGQVQGTAADSAVTVGNPVLTAARYNAAPPTYDSGDTATLQADVNGNLKETLATALSQAIDSILTYPRGSNFLNVAASGLVLTGAGKLSGIFVAAASSTPTIKVWDNTAGSGAVLLNTFTPVAGTLYPFPSARVSTGIFVTISGTVDCTVFYDPTTT